MDDDQEHQDEQFQADAHEAHMATAPDPTPIPNFPVRRYHPVHGMRTFADPNALHMAGPDWRFETAGEADSARTETEAQQVTFNNAIRKQREHEEAGRQVALNSAAAQESLDKGYPEPL